MKRPEGFDKVPAPGKERRAAGSTSAPGRRPANPSVPERPFGKLRDQTVEGPRPPRPRKPPKDTSVRDARREARAAAALRRRYEKQEIKRFTRRQRARRIAVGVTLGVVGAVLALVLVAIFSPILALRTVVVEGTSRVDVAAVQEAVESQLGTPLALIDYGRIDAALRGFPVIRSYTTETIPPGTMVVHVTEREPVVTIASPAGDFLFVDAAGVTVERSPARLEGVPLVTQSGTSLPNPAFDAAVEVLLAMPGELRTQIDTIDAKTRDDVWLTLAGVPQAVKWGSADDSLTKVRLLEILRTNFGGTPGVFDVSATSNGIFRPS